MKAWQFWSLTSTVWVATSSGGMSNLVFGAICLVLAVVALAAGWE